MTTPESGDQDPGRENRANAGGGSRANARRESRANGTGSSQGSQAGPKIGSGAMRAAAQMRPARDANGRFVQARKPAAARAVSASGEVGTSLGKLTAKLDQQALAGSPAASGALSAESPGVSQDDGPAEEAGDPANEAPRGRDTTRPQNGTDAVNATPTSGDTSGRGGTAWSVAKPMRKREADVAARRTDYPEEVSVDGQAAVPPWLRDRPDSEIPAPAAAPIPLPADMIAPPRRGAAAGDAPTGRSAGLSPATDLPADLPAGGAGGPQSAYGIPIPPVGEPPRFDNPPVTARSTTAQSGTVPTPDEMPPGYRPPGAPGSAGWAPAGQWAANPSLGVPGSTGPAYGDAAPTGQYGDAASGDPAYGDSAPASPAPEAAMPGGPVPSDPLPGSGSIPGGAMPVESMVSAPGRPTGWVGGGRPGATPTRTRSRPARSAKAGRVKVSPAQARGKVPRRAQLALVRVEPWSVMKFSFVISVVCFIVLFVAVAVLYGALAGLGVFDSLQRTIESVTSGQGSSGVNAAHWFSASRILGYTGVIGTVNVVLITAMSTVGAVLYNVASDLVGGIEVTLQETE